MRDPSRPFQVPVSPDPFNQRMQTMMAVQHSYFFPYNRSNVWNQTDTVAKYPATVIDPLRYLPSNTLHMTYPSNLTTQPCPVNKKNVERWTERERRKAEQARRIEDVGELREYVSNPSYVDSNTSYFLISD